MNIVFIGLGDPIPSFIKRRVIALLKNDVKVTLVLGYNQVCDLDGVSIVRAGGSLSVGNLTSAAVLNIIYFWKYLKLWRSRPELGFMNRLKWSFKYSALIRLQPSVIHFQWLSLMNDFSWLRDFYTCPFIASARGSQVTVYPFTKPGYKSLIQRALTLADYVHCVSGDISKQCQDLGADPKKLFINYNGIDLTLFKPNINKPKDANVVTILSIGNLIWRKGYYYQLQILKKLVEIGCAVKLLIVGDGQEREGLIYTARLLGVSGHVQFFGKIDAYELPGILCKSDLYISTSGAEGLANSVLEAVASGLPVVAFDCEGMGEVIVDGVNGYVLPFGDIEGMTNRILGLVGRPDLRLAMGFESRRIAEQKFDEAMWVSKMIATYHDLEKK